MSRLAYARCLFWMGICNQWLNSFIKGGELCDPEGQIRYLRMAQITLNEAKKELRLYKRK